MRSLEEERGRTPNLSRRIPPGAGLRLDNGRNAARSKVVSFFSSLADVAPFSFVLPSDSLIG
jgi:hypothetical protein